MPSIIRPGVELDAKGVQSYLIRWVNVKPEHTISWSVKPDKKSINFGIFKHPGSEHAPPPKAGTASFEAPPTPALPPHDQGREPQPIRNAQSTAPEKLQSSGLKPISWYGACEANRVSTGTYNVPKNEGGMYALVFDNTFSKQLSKKATFVLLTYPTDSPPQLNHHSHHVPGQSTESLTGTGVALSQRARPVLQNSADSARKVSSPGSDGQGGSDDSRNRRQDGFDSSDKSQFYSGVLQKHRRKKGQGWARRFFSLDYTTSTLSYYHDRNAQAIRGAVPLSMAAIGANAKTRQISIDSGAEIWHLKASNQKDFEAWKQALERARAPEHPTSPVGAGGAGTPARRQSIRLNPAEESEWSRAEAILEKVKITRDAARSLAKDTDPKYLPLSAIKPVSLENRDSNALSEPSSNSQSPSDQPMNGYFSTDGAAERRPFWKRKPSSDTRPMPGMFSRRSVSATPSITPQRSGPSTPANGPTFNQALQSHPEESGDSVHEHCMKLLRDLDNITTEFSGLVAESKQRRTPATPINVSRYSIDSTGSDEFFDAEGYNSSQLLAIHHESGDEADEAERSDEEDSGSESEYEEQNNIMKTAAGEDKPNVAFPPKAESLAPLPMDKIKRRTVVAPSTMQPPSMIGIFRKNVGKDLSTISAPVSVNEPNSLLQRVAETLEYSQLLDAAVAQPGSIERLMYISAFAISMLSSNRAKERAIRKPFNPMLGETYELVREDRGFRFLSEKVSHRPMRMAFQTDSQHWSLTQAPAPTQKFWGKSAEIITEGKYRVALHTTGDHFSWSSATCFLRNMIAGEKYVEPVGTLTITNASTGEKALVTFKSKGMFSGRSEDVIVQLFDRHGDEASLGLVGKWTSALNITESGSARANANPIWTAGDLVPDAAKRYGFTAFAATLNEVTSMEAGKIPPTDSRLRPDQRAIEDGDLDRAEVLKAKLEEAQRARRKVLEEKGEQWQPRWFRRVEGGGEGEGEEAWVAKGGGDGYWERRKTARWSDVEDIFE